MSVNVSKEIITRTEDVLMEKCSFDELGISPKTLEGLRASGFETPSPIQYKAIPIGLCGFGNYYRYERKMFIYILIFYITQI